MAFPNAANRDTIEQRRERVAQLRLRQLSAREISRLLAEGDSNGNGRMVNPSTGKAYDHKTILADLEALTVQWQQSASVNTNEHMARQFAEMQEIKKAAWAARNPELALKALDKEMKLLGTMKQPDGLTININLVSQLVQAIERTGASASELFEEMLNEFQNADRAGD
jgi:hypothetical protein